jgi:hypothetical protein
MRDGRLAVGVVALLVLSGLLGSSLAQQSDQAIHEALKKLLLTEDEVSELLGGRWVLDQTGRLSNDKEAELGNAISAFGIYLKRGRTRDDIIQLVAVLLQYQSESEAAALFERGLVSAIEPDPPTELPEECVKPVLEALKEIADQVQFFTYTRSERCDDPEGVRGLAFRKGARVGAFRSKLLAEQFVLLAKKQIEILKTGRP